MTLYLFNQCFEFVRYKNLANKQLYFALFRLSNPDKEPLEIDQAYWNLRDSITSTQLILLRLFNFQVTFETPHKVFFLKQKNHFRQRVFQS